MHTWTLSKNHPLLRFYRWLYNPIADSTLTFCRLFWGVIASPLVLLLYGVMFCVFTPVAWAQDNWPRRTKSPKQTLDKAAARTERAKKGRRIAEWMEEWWTKSTIFFNRHNILRGLVKLLWRAVVFFVIIGIPLGALAFGIYEAQLHYLGFIHGLEWTGGVSGSLFGIIAIGAVLGVTFNRIGVFDAIGNAIYSVIWQHVLCPVGRGLRFTGRFVVTGHHVLKYRTCPLIKVVDE